MKNKDSKLHKQIYKRVSNMYSNVDSIEKRLGEIIEMEMNRELTKNEEIEFTELKRYRNKLNPTIPFFG